MSVTAVILPSWIGDVVMATPALRSVKSACGGHRLVGLARSGLRELLDGAGLFDEIIDEPMRGLRGPIAAAAALRRSGSTTILVLPNSFRSAIAARLSGAARRIGWATEARGWLLTRAPRPPRSSGPRCTVDWYADLVDEAFGTRTVDRLPRLVPTAGQREAAQSLLAGVARPFAVLNPGANREDKRWPAERFVEVGRALRARGYSVVVNGGPAERELVARVASESGAVDLALRGVTLGSLLGMLAEAALLVTNDTGPRHMAIGVGMPVVALFGPTDQRWTAIAGARERRLVAEPFLPEEMVADRHAKACAIDRIEVGDVLSAVDDLTLRREGRRDEGTKGPRG